MLFIVGNDCPVGSRNISLLVSLHQAKSFADKVHIIAEVADTIIGTLANSPYRTVSLPISLTSSRSASIVFGVNSLVRT